MLMEKTMTNPYASASSAIAAIHPHGIEARAICGRASAASARADSVRAQHVVLCVYCENQFDLFAAAWCEHQELEPSKICPFCAQCVCQHPAYAEPHFWKQAPIAFERQGFRRLFLFYL